MMLRKTIEEFLGVKRETQLYEPDNEEKLSKLINVATPKASVTELVYTKRNEPVLLLKPKVHDWYHIFKLITFTYGNKEEFLIHFHIFNNEIEIIEVGVVQEEFHHKGYGSILIQEVIKFSKDNEIKRIYGAMVSESEEHHQRQISFYSKNGFMLYDNFHKFEMILN